MSEPRALPVAMIGPSAPNGPPVPIEIAAETGFKKCDPRRNAALVRQHLFHRLRDAMSPNSFRPVTGHQPYDQCADDRNRNDPQAEVRYCFGGR